MKATSLVPVVQNGFSLTPKLEDSSLTVAFSGNADMSAVTPLSMFLSHVHAEALQLELEEVTFDLKELYFMNSSCFKSFVTWINSVSTGDPKRAYRIRFLANPQQYWQRRSLDALRRMAQNIVSVES
jgi:hypothetical protein